MSIRNRPFTGMITGLIVILSLTAAAPTSADPEPFDTVLKFPQETPLEGEENPCIAARSVRDPLEIAFCLGAMALVLVLILYQVSKGVRQPVKVSVEPLAEQLQTVPSVSEYVQTTTDKLGVLGFSQQLDFTVPELPHKGFFRYLSLRDGSHTVLIYEIVLGTKGAKANVGFKTVQFFEFQTVLDGDVKINTGNNPLKNYLSPPPGVFPRTNQHLTEPRELFDEHRRHVEEVRTRESAAVQPQRLEEFFSTFAREWERTNDYQVSVGLFKRDASGEQYIGTPKIILRALLTGFKEDFGGPVGLVIPLMVACYMAGVVWSMPKIVAFTGLHAFPVLAVELETVAIGVLALTVGLASRVGGAVWGTLCYAPSAILFIAGPLGYLIPFVIAGGSGGLGEKLAFASMWKSWKDVRLLSPEIFFVAVAVLLAGLWG